MTTQQAAASSSEARSLGMKGQGVKLVQLSVQLCPLADDRYPCHSSFINVRYKNITPMRTQRDIIYICCLWKGNNICEGNWRDKRVNELWGNWQRGSAWGSPDSREPRSYWQLFSPQTRGPPWEAVTNKPPLWNNEAANISLTILNASLLKTMRQKESGGKATVQTTCTQILHGKRSNV